MKKMIAAIVGVAFMTIASHAQVAPPAKPMSKEDKMKMKEKADEDLNAAIKEAGLTDEQTKQVKDVIADASKKGNEIKKDAVLTDEDKKTKLKAISEEKNNKLKEIMGKEKYKLYNEARKKQKEAMTPPPPATPQAAPPAK